MMLNARQIKAARALLDWTQEDLVAETGLSIATICSLEKGNISPRSTTNNLIHQTFEKAGLEFEANGVRLRDEMVRTYEGPDSCELFFNDVMQTVREKGGEVVCGFKSSAHMAEICSHKPGDFAYLEKLSQLAPIKCLTAEVATPLPVNPAIQIRTISKLHIGPFSFMEYGNRYTLLLLESHAKFVFKVFMSAGMAQTARNHFVMAWENGLPIILPSIHELTAIKNPAD